MTVERGRLWGSDQHVPADTPVVATDTDLARAHQQGHLLVALDGGDLWRTLGGRGGVTRRLGTSTWVMPVDLARVTLDGADLGVVAAHVIARGRWWRGEAAAVMNAEWWGQRDMAPRAHPGDGRLDTIVGALAFRVLLQARSRVRSGTHVPHPALTVQRTERFAHTFPAPRTVWLDGVRRGRGSDLVVQVIPDAISVLV